MGRLELEGLEYEQTPARGWTVEEEGEEEEKGEQVGVNQRRGAPRLSIPQGKARWASERATGWTGRWMDGDGCTHL